LAAPAVLADGYCSGAACHRRYALRRFAGRHHAGGSPVREFSCAI
jgi:hypothetical protein